MRAPSPAPAGPSTEWAQRPRPIQSPPLGLTGGNARGPRPVPARRPSRWPRHVLAAATLLASAATISPAIAGSGWWPRTILAVAVVLVVGVLCRLARAPGAAIASVQLLSLTLAMALAFEATSFEAVGALVVEALAHVQGSVQPAEPTAALTFLIAVVLGLLAVIVDALAARAPALVAAPVLGVVIVGATFNQAALPWPALALPAAGYVLLLAFDGLGQRIVGVRAGLDVAAITAVLGGASVVIALLLTANATAVGTWGRLTFPATVQGPAGPHPMTSLVGDLLRGDPVELLRLEGQVEPAYVRTVALEEWTTNRGWSLNREPGRGGQLPEVEGDAVVVRVESLGYRGRFLPAPEGASSVLESDHSWAFDASLGVWHHPDVVDPGAYELLVDPSLPSADQLASDTVTGSGRHVETGAVPQQVRDLAAQVTAGSDGPFAQAMALQEWFTGPEGGFTYSLSVPVGNSGDRLLDFLQQRQGYCEQFASAMAVMARSLGLPARVAIGFGPGSTDSAGVTTITSHNAHAWVEVRFDDAGWVRFEPTPPGGGQGAEQGAGAAADPEAEATPTGEAAQGPAEGGPDATVDEAPDADAAPTAADGQDSSDAQDSETGGDGSSDADAPTTTGAALGRIGPFAGVVALALAGIGAVLRGPRAARRWRRSRRMSRVGDGGAGAAADAWTEIEDLALDHGLPLPATESARTTARRIARAGHLGSAALADLGDVVLAVERGWYAEPRAGLEPVQAEVGEDRSASGPTGATLTAAITAVADGLAQHRPLAPARRWFPASLLPSSRRG